MSKHTHPLYIWAQANGRKLGWLAAQAGISSGSLTAYLHQRNAAPKPVRLAFQTITEGHVSASDWPENGAGK